MSALPAPELRRRAARLRLVLSDVDGTLTDAGVYYSAEGEALKRFSLRDGMGVERLRERGVETAFLTRELSPIVEQRARKLKVRAWQGVKDKASALPQILAETGLAPTTLAFIGDDVNDLELLAQLGEVGLTGAPADAVPEVRATVHYVAAERGGHGAFRDFAEWILRLQAQAGPEERE